MESWVYVLVTLMRPTLMAHGSAVAVAEELGRDQVAVGIVV
jgi:hypothetical protein